MSHISAALPQKPRKQHHMPRISVAVLVAALVIVAVLAGAFIFRASVNQAGPAPAPQANVSPKSIAVVQQPAVPVAARSVFLSEQQLHRRIDQAAEHRWGARGQALLLLLNKRFEHRCCGLPR